MKRNSWILIVLVLAAAFLVAQPLSIAHTSNTHPGYASFASLEEVRIIDNSRAEFTIKVTDFYSEWVDDYAIVVIADTDDWTNAPASVRQDYPGYPISAYELKNYIGGTANSPAEMVNSNAGVYYFQATDKEKTEYVATVPITTDQDRMMMVWAGYDSSQEQFDFNSVNVVYYDKPYIAASTESEPEQPDGGETLPEQIEDIVSPEGGDNSLMIVGVAALAIGAFVFFRR